MRLFFTLSNGAVAFLKNIGRMSKLLWCWTHRRRIRDCSPC